MAKNISVFDPFITNQFKMPTSKKSFDSTNTYSASIAASQASDSAQKSAYTSEAGPESSSTPGMSKLKKISEKLFRANSEKEKDAKKRSINYESAATYLSLR